MIADSFKIIMIAIRFGRLSGSMRKLLKGNGIKSIRIYDPFEPLDDSVMDDSILLICTKDSLEDCKQFMMRYGATIKIAFAIDLELFWDKKESRYPKYVDKIKDAVQIAPRNAHAIQIVYRNGSELQQADCLAKSLSRSDLRVSSVESVSFEDVITIIPSYSKAIIDNSQLGVNVTIMIFVLLIIPILYTSNPDEDYAYVSLLFLAVASVCVQLLLELNIRRYKLLLRRFSFDSTGKRVDIVGRKRYTWICASVMLVSLAMIFSLPLVWRAMF